MKQTRMLYLLDMLNRGHPFRLAVLLTAMFFKKDPAEIEREFYRE